MKKIYHLILSIVFSTIIFSLTGCLSTEYKEYRFELNSDGSGEGSIIFYNLISVEDEEKNVSVVDFDELIADYINGNRFEDENPQYKVTNKELYEEDDVLVGKIEFEFDDLSALGFYRAEDCECAPLMYYLGDFGETYKESNGKYLGDKYNLPMITWEPGTDEIYIKSIVQEDLTGTHTLLSNFQSWEENQ